MSKRLMGVVGLWVALMPGCRHSGIQHLSRPPREPLIVFEGATNLRHYMQGPLECVSYDLEACYPARGIIRSLERRLGKLGWKAMEEDWRNPGSPSSYVAGWQDSMFGMGKEKARVRAWTSDWRNDNGEYVTYVLKYPDSARLRSTLQVFAQQWPPEAAKALMAEVARIQAKNSANPVVDPRLDRIWDLQEAKARREANFTCGQMLLVQGVQGAGVIDFTMLTKDSASYRWRFKDLLGKESSGRGRVFQKLEPLLPQPGLGEVMKDVGERFLKAGPFILEWRVVSWVESAAEPNPDCPLPAPTHAVLYFPDDMSITVLPNSNFAIVALETSS